MMSVASLLVSLTSVRTRVRVDAYQRLGRTYGDKLERERQALDSWINALDIDPHNLETLETLTRLYEESQAWVELIDILQRMVQLPEGVLEAERLRDLWAQIGNIQGELCLGDCVIRWNPQTCEESSSTGRRAVQAVDSSRE